jgi:phosphoglycolate phosphatase
MSFSDVEAIIFDKDGTLANSEVFLRSLGQRRSRLIDAQIPGVQEPLLMAFGIEGDRLNPGGLLALGTRRENEIAAAAYVAETGRNWIDAQQLVHRAFAEVDQSAGRKADQTPLFPGVVETLQRLATAPLKLGILSADTTSNVEDFVQRYGLHSSILAILGSDGLLGKPDPAFLEQICKELNVLPSQTIVVGDSQADMLMARAASAPCVGVTWGWSSAITLDADVIIQRIDEIEAIAP